VNKGELSAGAALLKQPVLPLVSMVQFLYLTGDFATVDEVIGEMPEPIETGYTLYENPRALLRNHLDALRLLESLKSGDELPEQVYGEDGTRLDRMTAITALVSQRVMEAELEPINSLLCGPCGCTLCCTGPDDGMAQEFFEIPLQDSETALFAVDRIDSVDSRGRQAMDENPLQVDGRPFYQGDEPSLVCWQNGWSMILPRNTSCPALEDNGRCRVYEKRPQVCRRPQIFSYVIEPSGPQQFRLRSSLLAIIDCPYVQVLRDEIGAYAAACELELIFSENKK
jgi:Fe-S-cluster containining protein